MTCVTTEAAAPRHRTAATRFDRFRRDEDGGLILFSLFTFIIMLIVGGVAVDVMRFETKRTALQNTLDSATLAATWIKRDSDPVDLVKSFMEKTGYDSDKVVVNAEEGRVGGDPLTGDEGTLVSRRVTASYDLRMNTFFMPLIGIDNLGTQSGGQAFERVQDVEISLVVDISGSMGGDKISDLKNASKNFFNSVIDEERTEGITTVSVIPYNHTIVVPDILLDRLNTMASATIPDADVARPSPGEAPYTGALTDYPLYSAKSKCIRFMDSQMKTDDLVADYQALRRIEETEPLARMAYYDNNGNTGSNSGNWDRPNDDWERVCDPTRGQIVLFGTDISDLEDYMDSLQAGGNTAIDNGIKWASALLDPEFRDIVSDLVDNDILPEKVRDRPGDYDPVNTLKVIVLMTDGANTRQHDLKPDFKNGASRIWFSEKASRADDPEGADGNTDWEDLYIVDRDKNGSEDREKRWYDGYYVLMPDNDSDERWMRPHKPWDSDDGAIYDVSELPDDARQLDYVELYDRFSENALAELFRDDNYGDWSARSAHRSAEFYPVSYGEADRRMNGTSSDSEYGICDAVKYKSNPTDDPDVLVFAIAFQAGSHAEGVMRECATSDGYYFDAANGEELNEAFAAIAGAISKLRLTQ